MDGKPLYEYARENKPLPRPIPVRECTVSIDLVDFQPAEVTPGDGGHTYRWPEKRLTAEEKETFSKLNKIVHDAEAAAAPDAKPDPKEPEVDVDAPEYPEVSEATALRPGCFTVRMTVSSGTYVRSIVHDIGLALGSVAHVVKLTRTRQGEFVLDESVAPPEAKLEVEDESTREALAHPDGPTTPCITWDVFERAVAERKEWLAKVEEEKKNLSAEEFEQQYGPEAMTTRRRTGKLKEWEEEVLRRFVPVPAAVVRDSKVRAAGLY